MILAFSIKNIYFIPFISAKFIKLFYAFWRCYTKTAEAADVTVSAVQYLHELFQILATPLARAASAVALATASFTRGSKALGRM